MDTTKRPVRPYFVKIETEIGEHRVIATRYGRWFGSFDTCAAFAARVGGQVWVQTKNGSDRLLDPLVRQ